MKTRLQNEIRKETQTLLKEARLTANYSINDASHRLNISETLFREYEEGALRL